MSNLREFACANERHPWDVRVKVGSERKFASSEKFAKVWQSSVSSKSGFFIAYSARGGTPFSFFAFVYWGEVALTLAIWLVLIAKNVFFVWFFILFAPRTGICSGIGSWRGSRTAPRASPRPSRVKVTPGVTAPSKINENRWKIDENQWKTMKIDEKRWRSNDFRWKKTMKINGNQLKSMKIN